ncbi:MAG: YigZ family protein [Prolixibacteraceae bacterium]|nr:YigZ family protein [Prolixibacteraceae bacterium]NLO00942.1 YigZ family protein [Bacteroidales bacterium]
MQDSYKSIKEQSEGYFKDRGSKFFSFAYPVETEEEIKEILDLLRKEHHSARHHCYAWRLGRKDISYRANDDGEPSSTAGKPILGQLQSFDVTNVLVVVIRYFGGTLLGTSGLINAYKSAAASALENAEIITLTIDTVFRLTYSYNEMNEVMRILKQENMNIIDTRFEDICRLDFSVRESKAKKAEKLFGRFHGVKIEKISEIN